MDVKILIECRVQYLWSVGLDLELCLAGSQPGFSWTHMQANPLLANPARQDLADRTSIQRGCTPFLLCGEVNKMLHTAGRHGNHGRAIAG